MENYILIQGEIGTDYTLKKLREAITSQADTSKYVVLIDSNGGDVDEGFLIRNYLLSLSKKTDLEIHVVGSCFSIATIIALASEKRFISPFGQFMTHLPFFDEFVCSGEKCNLDYFEFTTEQLRKATNQISKVYESTFGMSKNEVKEWLRSSVVYTAQEAVENGFFKAFSDIDVHNLKNIVNNKKPILKMKKNETFIQKVINKLLNNTETETKAMEEPKKEEEVKNLDTTLADGTAVRIDTESEEVVGAMIVSIESGEPLADGTYELSNGMTIIVESGLITSASETELEDAKIEELANELAASIDDEIKDEALTATLVNFIANVAKEVIEKTKNETDKAKVERIILAKKVQIKEKAKQELKTLKGEGKKHGGTMKNAGNDNLEQFRMAGIASLLRSGNKTALDKFEIKNAVINPDLNYTYNGIEQLRDTFYEPTIGTPEIKTFIGTIIYGVKSKQQLFLQKSLSKIVKKYAGNCSVTPKSSPAPFVENTLETSALSIDLEQCADDFDRMILQTVLNSDLKKSDLTGTFVKKLMEQVVTDAARRDFFRILSFGDISDANEDYNQLDGMWTQFLDSSSTVTKVNNTITDLDQTAGTTALDYLLELKEGASNVLDQLPSNQKMFLVTRNVYDNLYRVIGNKEISESYRALLDGETLKIDGIPVVKVNAWDDALTDTANPLNGVKNTLMVLTTKDNHVIGVDEQVGYSNQSLEFFYDRKSRKNIITGRFTLGYRYVFGGLVAISTGLVS